MATQLRFFLDASMYVCVGFGAVIPLLYLNVRFSRALGLIDWPKARGLAEDHVPIVGPSLVVVALVTLSVLSAYFTISPWVISSAAIIGLMGYFDDRRALPALDKLFFQLICSAAVVYLDPQISASLSAKFGMTGLFLGVVFMVAVMNAVNFIDGIDGLAGLVLLAAFGVIPFVGVGYAHAYPYVILSCVMGGALLPFLHLNVRRRKGFLGNVGFVLLGPFRRCNYRHHDSPDFGTFSFSSGQRTFAPPFGANQYSLALHAGGDGFSAASGNDHVRVFGARRSGAPTLFAHGRFLRLHADHVHFDCAFRLKAQSKWK
jgi:hypothetical protein